MVDQPTPSTPPLDKAPPLQPDHAPRPSHSVVVTPKAETFLPRLALAHDWLCGYRGGEAVLDRIAALAEHAGQTPRLYTMFDDGRPLAPAIDRLPKRVAALGRAPGASGPLRRWMLPLYPALVRSLAAQLARDLKQDPLSERIQALVSTSSAAIKGIEPPRGIPHLCYCHAPARYVWSQTEQYATGGIKGTLRGLGLRLFKDPFARWDKRSASNVTRFLANSEHIRREIERCFNRPATVVHPPVRTEFFTPDPSVERRGFWLVVSALEPYKRVDLAIRAAELAGVQLIIVGTGSQRRRLQAQAGSGVQLLGRVSDDKLRALYRSASLFVFPQIEDFGITAIEALACGCPVLARAAGGALDSVRHGENGALFESEDPAEIARAAQSVPVDADAQCRASAEPFSEERFDRAMRAQIRAVTA